ncbi:MAG: polysaccharide pyruvyl transferase family protein [Cyanobium sp. M30B3]|nr:MAG: polysaccharide pyruvyl transferase family protein [Cyanobium sp. M30B3]
MALPPPVDLGSLLLQRLAEIPSLAGAHGCALLNHPSHGNLGDHLIWIGQLHAIEQLLQIPVRYVASPDRYCPRALERAIGDGPIVLSGGGQLGDAWPHLGAFIERVVNGHRCNPLVILSQSADFHDPASLGRAAAVLQGHPDLTLVLRDRPSFELARRHFSGCRLLLAPDMAFSLPKEALCLDAPTAQSLRRPWLALARGDRELAAGGWQGSLDSSPWPVECSDWLPLERGWIWGDRRLPCSRSAATGVREIFQRRLLHPKTALMRHQWLRQLPPEWRCRAQRSSLHRLSLGMVHLAVHQLAGRELVITDRLHAVILASLLGIPSLALDNRTGKVHSFLRTWGAWLPEAQPVVADDLRQRLRQIAHHDPRVPVRST